MLSCTDQSVILEEVKDIKKILKGKLSEKYKNLTWKQFGRMFIPDHTIIDNRSEIVFYICLKRVFRRIRIGVNDFYYFRTEGGKPMTMGFAFAFRNTYKIQNSQGIIVNLNIDEIIEIAKKLDICIQFNIENNDLIDEGAFYSEETKLKKYWEEEERSMIERAAIRKYLDDTRDDDCWYMIKPITTRKHVDNVNDCWCKNESTATKKYSYYTHFYNCLKNG